MMRILTAEQIRALEAAADESGISYLRLMENAGAACAKAIRTRFDDTNKRRVVVLCGKGKNGGDGFVVARKLFENGYDVHVLLVQGPPKADNAREMFGWLRELEQPVEAYSPQSERQHALLKNADLLVDAVFGTGFSGVLPQELQALFDTVAPLPAVKISIDLPSGVCADDPAVEGRPFCADLTLSVMALKPALAAFPARSFAGEVEVVTIGVPKELYKPYEKLFAFSDADVAKLLPARRADAHKGDFGKALVVAGSYEMPGAALFASGGAVACGAGLVRLAFPDCAYAAVTAAVPEKVLLPLASNRFRPEGLPKAVRNSGEINAYACVGSPVDTVFQRKVKHGYYACVSYVDAQIGKILDALDSLGLADNTIVILLGDHGWNLGEHNFIGKHNLMDNSTHVPLIIRVPGMEKGVCRSMVEFVDVYPTLCELCGLSKPKNQLDGKSFAPVFQDLQTPTKPYVYIQWEGADNAVDPRFSYAHWLKDGVRKTHMLFDHEIDPGENKNRVEEAQYKGTVESMSDWLRNKRSIWDK